MIDNLKVFSNWLSTKNRGVQMTNPMEICPKCSNELTILFKCYKCDMLYCEQCTLTQKIDKSTNEIKVKFFCPKCNSELHEMINIPNYI